MNNLTILDVECHLVAKCWSIELLAEPHWIEWIGLIDPKVGSVNRDLADRPVVINQSVIPINLKKKEIMRWASFGRYIQYFYIRSSTKQPKVRTQS
jgi:hypothetical protein